MITWYHVAIHPNNVFGFKTDGVIILDHPERHLIGTKLVDYKPFLLKSKANVIAIRA